MKRLPWYRRPFFARRVLEIGGGHAPYAGVTHAVDKYPADPAQRAGAIVLAPGVEFREGELEKIPFAGPPSEPLFDFIYVSHVLEHVRHPARAVAEINRVARAGYLETPSPFREQVSCPFPFVGERDFHYLFCWSRPGELATVHTVAKTAETLGEFCSCEDGRLASRLFKLKRERGVDLEPLLPGLAKTTRLHFKTPLRVVEHASFRAACASGACAYAQARSIRFWTGPLGSLFASRFRELGRLLAAE